MKIILAPDSFKGSLSAIKVAQTMQKAIKDIDDTNDIVLKPMADGGEGTMEAMLSSIPGEKISIACVGPLGEKINTHYAILESKKAVIELAAIAGLIQVPIEKRNPDHTTTFGLGEAICDALDKGCTSITVCIGGSATNDGGLGMLLALGMKAWDEKGDQLEGRGKDLHQVNRVCFENIDKRIKDVEINVACDVDNPLTGNNGASVVYGPQKGASQTQVIQYDKSLSNYGELLEGVLKKSLKEIPGAGAAGGVGFALLAIGAELVSGAELLANIMGLEDSIKEADLVITGEGQSDEQTLYGKAPNHVALLANKYEVPVILLSGSLTGDTDKLREKFTGCFSIITKPSTLAECMLDAEVLLYEQTKQVFHFARSCSFQTARTVAN